MNFEILLLKIFSKLNLYAIKFKTKKELIRLIHQYEHELNRLGKTIRAVLQKLSDKEEKNSTDKIEHLRKQLNQSTIKIEVVDYGAGSPALNLSNEQIIKGRITNKIVGDISRFENIILPWSLLLFKLIREFKPNLCLELGTSLGLSTAYQVTALELNKKGKIYTLEGSESLASIAQNNLIKLDLNRFQIITGRFDDTLDDILKDLKQIDHVLIDGHHNEFATLNYFEKIYPFLSDNSIMIFDDIYWSVGMQRAWRKISNDNRVQASIDMGSMGICIFSKHIKTKKRFKITL